jgi:serine protease AprX
MWAQKDAAGKAITGQGVTVALLDTGVDTSTVGLDGAGKVVKGPDLSLEANSPDLRGKDTFGHGTHMASIIGARDPVPVNPSTGQPLPANSGVQLGIALDATLLAVKLATSDGSTDVSQVIAGLDWVVQHRNDNGMRVRVINRSYGTCRPSLTSSTPSRPPPKTPGNTALWSSSPAATTAPRQVG